MPQLNRTSDLTAGTHSSPAAAAEPSLADAVLSDPVFTEDRPLRVLFVCTGNTCRSPMAAALLNERGKALGIRAASAGLAACDGMPITPQAVSALRDRGIPETPDNPYSHHTARNATARLIADYDRILGLSAEHAMALLVRFPEAASKISCLPQDIPDPFGGSDAVYRACLDAIESGLQEVFLL